MKRNRGSRAHVAFTAIDLLIVLAVIAAVTTLILSNLARPHRGARIQCVSNLKQVGLAFRMWANDHEEQFPMAVPKDREGAMESALTGQALSVYQVMEKELNTPKTLHCPNDSKRERAVGFEALATKHLSYLVGLDATVTNTQSILGADRNVSVNGSQLRLGLAVVADHRQVGWSKTIHKEQGNILLGDGSAAQTTAHLLQRQFESSGITINRFVVP